MPDPDRAAREAEELLPCAMAFGALGRCDHSAPRSCCYACRAMLSVAAALRQRDRLLDCDPGDGTPRGCGGVCRACMALSVETLEGELRQRDERIAELEGRIAEILRALRQGAGKPAEQEAVDGLIANEAALARAEEVKP